MEQNEKLKASVLTYIIGNYEVVHEIEYKTPGFEYVLVTDNHEITSSTWNVLYVNNPHPEDNFDACFNIRYNPFYYVTTDVVIKIDGSMGVAGNLDYLVDYFNKNNYDICLEMHPTRMSQFDEYVAWVQQRNYPIEQANKVLNFLHGYEGYDVKKNYGLYQYNFMIQRRNKVNLDLNMMTLSFCKYLAPEGKQIDRLDQTIGSFVINKYFNKMNVLPVSQGVAISGKYFKWFAHNSNTQLSSGNYEYCQPYLFGQPINTVYMME